jgi:hypothetical protein
MAGAGFAVLAAVSLVTASCTRQVEDEEEPAAFDRAVYCQAMHSSTLSIDADAMNSGNLEAMEAAAQTYEHLAQLAPVELAYEWRIIISGMGQMIREAGGEDAASDEETAEFRSAYQIVYTDYIDKCADTVSPAPSNTPT